MDDHQIAQELGLIRPPGPNEPHLLRQWDELRDRWPRASDAERWALVRFAQSCALLDEMGDRLLQREKQLRWLFRELDEVRELLAKRECELRQLQQDPEGAAAG
ncbi:MAG: hypothetical protein AAGH15_28470 [Myxococcota bacterium]